MRRVAEGLPLPLVWGTYVGDNRVLVRTASGTPLLAFADDLGVTPMLLADGDYDRPFTRFVASVLRRGDVAVDVGANIGVFTVPMALAVGETGRVIAYEPNPEVADLLGDNVYLNRNSGKLTAEVKVRPVAVGAGAAARARCACGRSTAAWAASATPTAVPRRVCRGCTRSTS